MQADVVMLSKLVVQSDVMIQPIRVITRKCRVSHLVLLTVNEMVEMSVNLGHRIHGYSSM